jgi:ATP-dependent helicase HrpA
VHAKRRVAFAAVDPAGAHEIFLREALVEGRLGVRAPFLEHNRAQEREVLALEVKLRRRDMLATTSQRRAAYAARVPPHLADRRAFEAWRRDAERRDPRILYLTRDELLGSDPPAVEPGDYPDRVELEGNALELQYRFEPGAESDGVTIVVPQALLGSVSQAFLDRLVPGHLGEKIGALLRSLPKATRKVLPALRPLALALASGLRDDPRPLSVAVAEHVRATARIAVDDDLLREASLSPHLRPRVRVVDRDGRVVAEDRDLAILQSRHAKTGATAVSAPRWERDGMVRFDVDEIAEEVTVQEGGVRLRAWPALEDRGTSVALRPMRSRRAAARATRFGLARLFMLQLPQQAKWIRDRIAADPKAALLVRGLGTPAQVGDELALLVFESVFAPVTAPAVRTRAVFEARLRERRAGVVDASAAPLAALQRSLELWRALLARLASSPATWAQAVADMREQLGALIHPGFLRGMTAEQLRELPRYLQGIAVRLDKLRDAQGRDAGLAAQVRPHWERYRVLPEEARAAAEPGSELSHMRWLIEELRVSLFAQQLGTRERVSAQRLERQWEKVRAELREPSALR